MAQRIQEAGIDLPALESSDFDEPFGNASGAGLIFGATGGVMEAALRSVVEIVTVLKAEALWNDLRVESVRGFEGNKYMELTIPQVGPVPDLLKQRGFTD